MEIYIIIGLALIIVYQIRTKRNIIKEKDYLIGILKKTVMENMLEKDTPIIEVFRKINEISNGEYGSPATDDFKYADDADDKLI